MFPVCDIGTRMRLKEEGGRERTPIPKEINEERRKKEQVLRKFKNLRSTGVEAPLPGLEEYLYPWLWWGQPTRARTRWNYTQAFLLVSIKGWPHPDSSTRHFPSKGSLQWPGPQVSPLLGSYACSSQWSILEIKGKVTMPLGISAGERSVSQGFGYKWSRLPIAKQKSQPHC